MQVFTWILEQKKIKKPLLRGIFFCNSEKNTVWTLKNYSVVKQK